MSQIKSQILHIIADQQGKYLDAHWTNIARRMGVDTRVLNKPMQQIVREGLAEVIEKQSDGVKLYRLTAAGWAAIGVAPPMGMEPV